jgi:probable HAF family extracellular repeat protein
MLPVIALASLLGVSNGFAQGNFSFATFDVPGAQTTSPLGINDSGQIVGIYSDHSSVFHAFLFDEETFTTIDVPGGQNTVPFGINTSGQIVGYYLQGGAFHGFSFDGATFMPIDVGVPGTTGTLALGINDAGVIVGTYFAQGHSHGFSFDGATFTTVDCPGADDTAVNAINTAGQIVGAVNSRHAFVGNGVTCFSIDFPGASESHAQGINDAGEVTGWHITFPVTSFGADGYASVDGINNLRRLTFPLSVETTAEKVNNFGQVVGSYKLSTDFGSPSHGFLMTPVVRGNCRDSSSEHHRAVVQSRHRCDTESSSPTHR